MAETVEQILGWYERGVIVAGECVDELCKIAVDIDPGTMAAVIPPRLLGRIQERTVDIPRAEELISIRGGTFSQDSNWDLSERDTELMKARYVDGLRTWKTYFECVEQAEYEALVRRSIEIGLKQIENGEGIPHEELKQRLSRWFK